MSDLDFLLLLQIGCFFLACAGYGIIDIGSGGRGRLRTAGLVVLGLFAAMILLQSRLWAAFILLPGFLLALLLVVAIAQRVALTRPLMWGGLGLQLAALAVTWFYSAKLLASVGA